MSAIITNSIWNIKCNSENIDYATRVIGYLTKVSKWSLERQAEFKRRANG